MDSSGRVGNVGDRAHIAFELPSHPMPCDDGYARTAPKGSYRPNGFGLHDMTGNVWEWCQDNHSDGYYAESPSADPPGPRTGQKYRVRRGGSWSTHPAYCRSANRDRNFPENRLNNGGFRIVAEIP